MPIPGDCSHPAASPTRTGSYQSEAAAQTGGRLRISALASSQFGDMRASRYFKFAAGAVVRRAERFV